jgi:hypothetical protein
MSVYEGDTTMQDTTTAIKTLPTDQLQPNDYNPNRMTKAEFAELVEEVKHLGRLPKPVIVRPGGAEDGFVFKRSAGTVEPIDEDGLSTSERATLEALRALGSMGAFDKDWREETIARGLSRATYYRSRETLVRLDFVEQVMNKFFVKIPAKPKSHEVSKESHETNETTANGGGLMRSHPLKGETNETTHAETCICDECLPE